MMLSHAIDSPARESPTPSSSLSSSVLPTLPTADHSRLSEKKMADSNNDSIARNERLAKEDVGHKAVEDRTCSKQLTADDGSVTGSD